MSKLRVTYIRKSMKVKTFFFSKEGLKLKMTIQSLGFSYIVVRINSLYNFHQLK